MPLYRGNDITLDTRLRVGETVKVVLFNRDRTKIYLTYELPPTGKSPDEKPSGYGLPGGGIEKEETVRDAAYSEVRNETGFITVPIAILYVHIKKNHNPLADYPHRLIIVLSSILPSDGQADYVPSGEYTPQARIVEDDEVDPKLNGWFPIDNLPIQICKGDDIIREGLYISHLLYIYEVYADGVINVKPYCEDIMHKVAEKISELDQRRKKWLIGETSEAVVAPDKPEDEEAGASGWNEKAIKDLQSSRDDEYRKWAESPA